MWQTNILMQHQPMNYCQHTIHPIDCQQNNPAEIFRTDYQHTDQKEDHESNANRTYIPRKTLCLFPEIEEVENKDTAKHRQNKILFYERNDRLIDISKGYENNQ